MGKRMVGARRPHPGACVGEAKVHQRRLPAAAGAPHWSRGAWGPRSVGAARRGHPCRRWGSGHGAAAARCKKEGGPITACGPTAEQEGWGWPCPGQHLLTLQQGSCWHRPAWGSRWGPCRRLAPLLPWPAGSSTRLPSPHPNRSGTGQRVQAQRVSPPPPRRGTRWVLGCHGGCSPAAGRAPGPAGRCGCGGAGETRRPPPGRPRSPPAAGRRRGAGHRRAPGTCAGLPAAPHTTAAATARAAAPPGNLWVHAPSAVARGAGTPPYPGPRTQHLL